MLNREKIAVSSEIHTKHINTLCGQKVQFVNFGTGGTYSDHRVLKCLMCIVVLRGTRSLMSNMANDPSVEMCRTCII